MQQLLHCSVYPGEPGDMSDWKGEGSRVAGKLINGR
jgi:hypothetical protein